jgi:hypothetical protein
MLEPKADGIGQPVTEDCADGRSKPDRPELQTACPDQGTDPKKQHGRGDEQRHNGERLGEG